MEENVSKSSFHFVILAWLALRTMPFRKSIPGRRINGKKRKEDDL